MAVPNIPFLLSRAATEFGVAKPARASAIFTKAGLSVTGLVSRLAGKSAGTYINVASWKAFSGTQYYGFDASHGSVEGADIPNVGKLTVFYSRGNALFIGFNGIQPATKITVEGFGTVNAPKPASSFGLSVPWNGLGAFLATKVGTKVKITIVPS